MENEFINTGESLSEHQTSMLHKEDIISRFGECKYSIQLTFDPSWFHTIIIKDYTIYIQEWIDSNDPEIYATIFTEGKKNPNGFSNTNLLLLLDDIVEFVKI